MSSYYIFDTDKKSTLSSVTNNLNMGGYAITNLKTYPTNNSDAISRKYVDDETSKLLDLAATRQMTGDLDMGNQSIVGIRDINADNSVSSKKFILDSLALKLSLTGGALSGALDMNANKIVDLGEPSIASDATTKKYVDDELAKKLSLTGGIMAGTLNMANHSITNIPAPTQAQHPASKSYVDTKLASLQNRDVYHFSFAALGTSYAYPIARYVLPTIWMMCKNLTNDSYFHLMLHAFDDDNNIETTVRLNYFLEFFDNIGRFFRHEFLSNQKVTLKLIPGEKIAVYDHKFYVRDFPGNISNLRISRLAITRTSSETFGNESTVTCAWVI